MTKRERLVLFMVGATLFNVLVTAIIFVALIVVYNFTFAKMAKAPSAAIFLGIDFLLAIIASSFVYKKALEALRKRINFEEKFGSRL
jgi:uncharacterized membrane protein